MLLSACFLYGCVLTAPEPAAAAEPSVGPRMAQALELASLERRLAESRLAAAASSAPARASAEAALARALAWSSALSEAAPAARPQDGDIVVSATKGVAHLSRSGEVLALRRGMLLREGDELVTTEGRAELRFHDGSLLAAGPGTSLRVFQAPRGFPQQSAFTLTRGGIYWEAPQTLAGLTRLLAPGASAQLRAGKAELSLDADGTARLAVREGSVELTGRPEGGGAHSGWWEEVHR